MHILTGVGVGWVEMKMLAAKHLQQSCLSSASYPPITRDSNWPKSLPAAFKVVLLTEDSDQELVYFQFCYDQIALQITLKCTFQFRG